MGALTKVSAIPVKNIKIIKDSLTGTSRGYGVAEFNSIQEATQVQQTMQNLDGPFEVDGKALIVSYAKNTFTTM